jgi:hypothetical protein
LAREVQKDVQARLEREWADLPAKQRVAAALAAGGPVPWEPYRKHLLEHFRDHDLTYLAAECASLSKETRKNPGRPRTEIRLEDLELDAQVKFRQSRGMTIKDALEDLKISGPDHWRRLTLAKLFQRYDASRKAVERGRKKLAAASTRQRSAGRKSSFPPGLPPGQKYR